jgi:hypothetical protein
MARQAANAFGDNSIPWNIAILEDSGTVPEAAPERKK